LPNIGKPLTNSACVRLVLEDVPVLGELAVFDADDLGGDPDGWTTNVREAAVSDDEVTLGKDQLILIAQRLRQRANEIKRARAPGRDMGAALDKGIGPEPLGPCTVGLVEQGLEGFEHEGFVLFGLSWSCRTPRLNQLAGRPSGRRVVGIARSAPV
jgi:hypothetical protein